MGAATNSAQGHEIPKEDIVTETSVTQDTTIAYVVTFERVGRHRDLPPLTVRARDGDHLAQEIYRYVRPSLMSRDVEIVVDVETGEGNIFCGFNNGGTFTVVAEAGVYAEHLAVDGAAVAS